MKTIKIAWVVAIALSAFLAVHFSFPAKARGEERAVSRTFKELCLTNARLAEQAEELYSQKAGGELAVYRLKGRVVAIPKKFFFLLILDLAERSGKSIPFEVYDALMDDQVQLMIATGRL